MLPFPVLATEFQMPASFYAFILMTVLLWVVNRMANGGVKTALPAPVVAGDELDKALYAWDEENVLTCRNLLAGGIHALGRTDGGKSSSMRLIARAILRHQNSSLLVLCPKKGEYRDWLKLAEEVGREDDVILIDPAEKWRFNMIGYLGQPGNPARAENIVRFIMEMKSVIFREQANTGGESEVWRKYDETAIRNCVIALLTAGEEVTGVNLHRLILSAPVSPADVHKKSWQEGYCNTVVLRGYRAEKSPVQKMDFEMAMDYLMQVWPAMADRTRGSVLMGVSEILNTMNIGMSREMFAGETNITPKEAIEGRKIVIVNMPPDEWGDVGVLANCGWKYHWQKEVLRREIAGKSPIAGIWGDESSIWVSEFDSEYVSRCRSYRGFQVYICQSLSSYHKTIAGQKAESVTESLLSNFSHKLLFSLGDYQSAEWAANLCGKDRILLASGGTQHSPFNPAAFFSQGGSTSSSFHEQFDHLVRPEDFMSGLRTGSPVNQFLVDAWLVRSGVPFSNGMPILQVTFNQRS